MTWPGNDDEQPNRWPTLNTRLTWARNNYRRPQYPLSWKVQKLLLLLVNLVALNELIEEESGESLLSASQKKAFMELYQSFRPTQPVGHPKNTS